MLTTPRSNVARRTSTKFSRFAIVSSHFWYPHRKIKTPFPFFTVSFDLFPGFFLTPRSFLNQEPRFAPGGPSPLRFPPSWNLGPKEKQFIIENLAHAPFKMPSRFPTKLPHRRESDELSLLNFYELEPSRRSASRGTRRSSSATVRADLRERLRSSALERSGLSPKPSQDSKRQSPLQDDQPQAKRRKKSQRLSAVYLEHDNMAPAPSPPIKAEPGTPKPPAKSEIGMIPKVKTESETELESAIARGIPLDYCRITEDGTFKAGPSEGEMNLWRALIKYEEVPTKFQDFWRELRRRGRQVLGGRNIPTMKDTRQYIVDIYTEYVSLVFPVKVLKTILAGDGVIDRELLAGKKHRGLLANHEIKMSVKKLCPVGFNVNFLMSSLEIEGFPRAPMKDYLEKIQVPPPPDIIGWYLKNWNGKQQLQKAMERIRGQYGYYEEFDWDEFGLGISVI
ncbi:hypothetical protein B0T16DRAFT_495038 [Cercophora newfieldiana]|uniref:Uncharacterized protein n=1 Tax=Cercophora newfieldiana TaxID=92897 RepID=A0AA40CNT1_9PEZI|nr:hypothetical protein B0T16DRAFT_495038 [Cercophora newfieldiana]